MRKMEREIRIFRGNRERGKRLTQKDRDREVDNREKDICKNERKK